MFHQLHTTVEPPRLFTYPFCYEPHPLCLMAKKEVEAYVSGIDEWKKEVEDGKMFGVLVCSDADGSLGYLAAYSGQIGGREDWPWFVPAVFDYLQPDGYFKQEEANISAINRAVADAEGEPAFLELQELLASKKAEAEREVNAYKETMLQAKQRRDEIRAQLGANASERWNSDLGANASERWNGDLGANASERWDSGIATLGSVASLERESQYQKAELRRMKKRWSEAVEATESRLKPLQQHIARLKHERSQRSDALQRWLFNQFAMRNALGQNATLTDIFAPTPQRTPPAGAGECCAPKLLQYAYLHGLRPLCMAEFWQGSSPQGEVRHHGQCYPSCRGKCKPILEFMLQGLDVAPDPRCMPSSLGQGLEIIHRDEHIVVVNKPAGMLSVPGLTGQESAESVLRERFGGSVFMAHRLDQDTSGLLVCALTEEAYHGLQRQFLQRTVSKRYVAIVDGIVKDDEGTISLPIRPSPLDRPRQVADLEHGKQAVTSYKVLSREGGQTRLLLMPHTGRTHQLRLHCAHAQGLGCPIAGDPLYGRTLAKAQRMMLHAEAITFHHPVTNETLTFASPAPF